MTTTMLTIQATSIDKNQLSSLGMEGIFFFN